MPIHSLHICTVYLPTAVLVAGHTLRLGLYRFNHVSLLMLFTTGLLLLLTMTIDVTWGEGTNHMRVKIKSLRSRIDDDDDYDRLSIVDF